MPEKDTPWGEEILSRMKPGAVTFGWDDGEIRTVDAPEATLDKMDSAWKWIDAKLREFEQEKGKPRSVCFRLTGGEFRGLKFPDWNTDAL